VAEHSERLRVQWVDTDTGGRIHFTAAFRWAEAAETNLLRKLGLLDESFGDFPRRRVEADYLHPLRFDDEIDVLIRVESVGRTSIRFAWDVVHEGETAITGAHTVVHVDDTGRPAPVDDRMRSVLSS
jgi:YbgC/YbaW family acyl-CoA thioester hydrolase